MGLFFKILVHICLARCEPGAAALHTLATGFFVTRASSHQTPTEIQSVKYTVEMKFQQHIRLVMHLGTGQLSCTESVEKESQMHVQNVLRGTQRAESHTQDLGTEGPD